LDLKRGWISILASFFLLAPARQYILTRLSNLKSQLVVYNLVFHRILDFKRGRISIQPFFYAKGFNREERKGAKGA